MDKVALGRRGEIFVMQKMLGLGWRFPDNLIEEMNGSDWIFEKNNLKVKVQVKTSLKKYPNFSYTNKNFDYLIFTNLIDCWILPKEVLRTSTRLTKTYKKLLNAFDLIGLQKQQLLTALMDYKITPSELDETTSFFQIKPLTHI